MTRIELYERLRAALGEESAKVLAEYIEEEALKGVATKEDVRRLEGEIEGIKKDVEGIKKDLDGLKESMGGIKKDLQRLEVQFAEVRASINFMLKLGFGVIFGILALIFKAYFGG